MLIIIIINNRIIVNIINIIIVVIRTNDECLEPAQSTLFQLTNILSAAEQNYTLQTFEMALTLHNGTQLSVLSVSFCFVPWLNIGISWCNR